MWDGINRSIKAPRRADSRLNDLTYGTEGLLREGRSVTISGNTVVNRRANGLGILNRSKVPMTVTNNTLYGITQAQFLNGTTGTVSGNVVTTTLPVLDTSHPYTR